MHIGILGAAFNPPHLGHLLMAQQALDFAHFDEVWFTPTYHHTFAKQTELPEHRLAMAKLMVAGNPRFKVSALEIEHVLDGNTINLLPILRHAYPQHLFTFIIGSDNLPTFHKWGRWQELVNQLPFLVIPRAGHANTPLYENMSVLEHPLLVITNISSTGIRQRLKAGLPIGYFVTSNIQSYIQKHKLYK